MRDGRAAVITDCVKNDAADDLAERCDERGQHPAREMSRTRRSAGDDEDDLGADGDRYVAEHHYKEESGIAVRVNEPENQALVVLHPLACRETRENVGGNAAALIADRSIQIDRFDVSVADAPFG